MNASPAINPQLAPGIEEFVALCRQHSGSLFDPAAKVFISRAPGRLDLLGGNDDYTGGLVFETTIREATFFAAQPRTDGRFVLVNPSVRSMGWHERVEFTLEDLYRGGAPRNIEELRAWINADPNQNWIATLVGNLYYLKMKHPQAVASGLNMLLDSSIPLGKGVSSSAALEAAGMKACAAAYGIRIEGIELATQTQWVENAIAQSASGIMDQFAVIMGNVDSFTPMTCQPCIPHPLVKLPHGLRIWGLDSGVRHSVAGIEYESARAATFMGYQLICEMAGLPVRRDDSGILARYTDPRWDGYMARISPSLFRRDYEDALPKTLSGAEFLKTHPVHFDPYTPVRPEVNYPVRNCARYAVEENYRVQSFYELIRLAAAPLAESTLQALGELMYGAHTGYSDCGLGSAETDLIVELVRAQAGHDLFGAKITGGGAGGTVAVLGRDSAAAQQAFEQVVAAYRQETGIAPYIFTGSSQGADAFGILEL